MKIDPHATPLPSSSDLLLFYTAVTSTKGTPLPDANEADRAVLVRVDVIQTYQRMIFELQQEVLRYKTHLDALLQRSRPIEEPAEPSHPLTSASVALLNSILAARIPEESVLRAYDPEEQ